MDNKLLVKTTKGMLKARPKNKQEEVSLGRPGYGQNIVGGHGQVGDDDDPDGLGQGLGLLFDLFLGRSLHKQLDGDPDDDRPADEFDEIDLQQLGGEEGQSHPQDYRRPGPEGDAARPLLARQGAHRHGDDHGIVPGQNEVDEDDAQKPGYKFPVEMNLSENA